MIYSSFNFLQIKHPARVIILFVIIDNVIIRDFQSVRHEIFPGESFTLEGLIKNWTKFWMFMKNGESKV